MLTAAEIKQIKSLSDKTSRTRCGLYVGEGEKFVGEALASQAVVERLFVTERAVGAIAAHPLAQRVSTKEMSRLSNLKTPTDCLAVIRIADHTLDEAIFGKELVLALDDVQDPGNMGTIIRIADWFGIGNIVCSMASADCYNPKVVQASMGALLRVGVHYRELGPMLDRARGSGVAVYGTFLDGEDIYGAALSPAGIVVMGNEGRGISPSLSGAVTDRLFIPPYPPHRQGNSADRQGSESLNVAVATAIVCSEFRRRRS